MSSRLGARLCYGIFALAIVLGALELLAHFALVLLAHDSRFDFTPISERLARQSAQLEKILAGGERLLMLDAELGWVYARGRSVDIYSINAQGVRARRTYSARPPAGVLRVAAFGDSFVHGLEVNDEAAWSAQVEQMDPRVEVLNYGVGGYGTDQALLAYRRLGQQLDPSVVVLGFPEVDLLRNLSRYRVFHDWRDLPLFKPRFVLGEHGELRLVPSPFPGEPGARRVLAEPRLALEAGVGDGLFEPLVWRNPLYDHSQFVRLASTIASRAWRSRLRPDRYYVGGEMNRRTEAFPLLVAIVRAFAREVENAGDTFIFIIFPNRDEDIWGRGRRAYAPLVESLPGITILDLADALRADPQLTPANLREPSDHYSPLANRAVARAVLELLRARGLLAPAAGRLPWLVYLAEHPARVAPRRRRERRPCEESMPASRLLPAGRALGLVACAALLALAAAASEPPDWNGVANIDTVSVATSNPDGTLRYTTVWLAVVGGRATCARATRPGARTWTAIPTSRW